MPTKTSQIKDDASFSERIGDIVLSKPHWIIEYGNGILFLAVVLGICLTWFIKYPDIIGATCVSCGFGQANQGKTAAVDIVIDNKSLKKLDLNNALFIKLGCMPEPGHGRSPIVSMAKLSTDRDSTLIRIYTTLNKAQTDLLKASTKEGIPVQLITSDKRLLKRLFEKLNF